MMTELVKARTCPALVQRNAKVKAAGRRDPQSLSGDDTMRQQLELPVRVEASTEADAYDIILTTSDGTYLRDAIASIDDHEHGLLQLEGNALPKVVEYLTISNRAGIYSARDRHTCIGRIPPGTRVLASLPNRLGWVSLKHGHRLCFVPEQCLQRLSEAKPFACSIRVPPDGILLRATCESHRKQLIVTVPRRPAKRAKPTFSQPQAPFIRHRVVAPCMEPEYQVPSWRPPTRPSSPPSPSTSPSPSPSTSRSLSPSPSPSLPSRSSPSSPMRKKADHPLTAQKTVSLKRERSEAGRASPTIAAEAGANVQSPYTDEEEEIKIMCARLPAPGGFASVDL